MPPPPTNFYDSTVNYGVGYLNRLCFLFKFDCRTSKSTLLFQCYSTWLSDSYFFGREGGGGEMKFRWKVRCRFCLIYLDTKFMPMNKIHEKIFDFHFLHSLVWSHRCYIVRIQQLVFLVPVFFFLSRQCIHCLRLLGNTEYSRQFYVTGRIIE